MPRNMKKAQSARRAVKGGNLFIFRMSIFVVILAVFAALGFSVKESLADTWAEPGAGPPNPNVAGPIWLQNAVVQNGGFWVSGNGNFGTNIGTGSTQLSVYHATSGPIVSLFGATTVYRGISIKNTSGTEQWFSGANDNNLFVIRRTGSSNDIVINGSGSVGIGNVASPAEALDVNGRVVLEQTTAPATTTNKLYNISGNLYWNGTQLGSGGSQTPWTSHINAASYNLTGLGTNLTAAAGLTIASTGAALAINPGSGALTSTATSVTLGGGLATIYGGSAASGNIIIDSTSNATKGYVILNPTGGNVGIGNSAPGATLSLGTASTRTGTLSFNHASNAFAVTMSPSATTSASYTLTLPTSVGGANQLLANSGTAGVLTWVSASGGTPAGSSGQAQFNNSGAFGADALFFWDNTNKRLGIGNGAPGATLSLGTASTRTGTLSFNHASNAYAVTLTPSATTAANYSLTLPVNVPASNGMVLSSTTGGVLSWATDQTGSTAPAGSTGYVQFNNAGAFGSDSTFFWDNTNKRLGIGNGAPGQVLTVGASGKLGTIGLAGNTSGVFTIQPAAAAGTFTLVLPSAAPSAGQVLSVSSYSAPTITTSWTTISGGGTMTCGGTCGASYIPKFTSGTAIANSLMYDNGTGIGIGTTSPGYNLHVVSSVSGGRAIYGYNSNGGYGVYGSGNYGLYGTGTAAGVYGNGAYGVQGVASGGGVGVYGEATSSYGVYGKSTTSYGVYGTTGTAGAGVYGLGTNGGTFGVYGYNSGAGNGVRAYSATGEGLYAEGSVVGVDGVSATTGVRGDGLTNGTGVYGTSTNGYGVYGWSSSDYGLYGQSISSYGVYGDGSTYGFYTPDQIYAGSNITSGGSLGGTYLYMTYGANASNFTASSTSSAPYYASAYTSAGQFVGNWSSSDWWAIGPDNGGSNRTVRIGGASSSGAWNLAKTHLAVYGWATFRTNDQTNPETYAGGGLTIGWNKSGSLAEVDFFNIYYNGSTGANREFSWYGATYGGGGSYTELMYLTSGGVLWAAGGYTSSDRSLKKNIVTLNDSQGLDAVMKLDPVSFDWKDPQKPGRQMGFVAQNVQSVLPELVSADEKNGLLGVNYNGLIASTIKALQEQQKEIEDLKLQIEELKAEIK
jgi:hypothetical protein